MKDDYVRPKKATKSVPAETTLASDEVSNDKQTKLTPTKDSSTKTEAFRTPDEIAAEEEIVEKQNPQSYLVRKSKHVASKLDLHWPPGKKEWLVAAALLLFVGGLASALLFHKTKPVATATPIHKAVIKKLPPKPKTVASNLTGLQVNPDVNSRPVTGIMIENSIDARPQSGLSQAGVIFEAIAEGGVTRFLALFQDNQPDDVGPIRSARPYYVSWALGFDAGYAHVGGSPDGLADIRAWQAKDLDQFANGGSYHRIDSRYAPHNVYTSLAALTQLQTAKGYTSSTFTSFPRKAETPSTAPTAKTIDLGLSGPIYNAHYDYIAASNSYNRSEGGEAHIDANGSQQISPKVVVALVVPLAQGALDDSGAYYSDYTVVGSGTAYVFQDGLVTIGTWTKASNAAQIVFADNAGKALPLNPGQTWITAVTSAGDISSAP